MSLAEQIQRVDGSQNDILKKVLGAFGVTVRENKIDRLAALAKLAPLLKENSILSSDTRALYNLGPDAVPDDVLAYVGKYNQHWWKRRSAKVTYKLTQKSNQVVFTWAYGQTDTGYTVEYSEKLSSTGLADPVKSAKVYFDSSAHPDDTSGLLKGVFFYGRESGGAIGDLFFVEKNAPDLVTGSYNGFTGRFVSGCSLVENLSVQYGEWEYVQSSSRSAYPDSGEQDGYEYHYLGIPFENAATAPKIATGSYVGTGKYGSSNPNSLAFEFEPKFVFIYREAGLKIQFSSDLTLTFSPDITVTDGGTGAGIYDYYFLYGGQTYKVNKVYWSDDLKTVYWYGDSSSDQVNNLDYKYHYLAIG